MFHHPVVRNHNCQSQPSSCFSFRYISWDWPTPFTEGCHTRSTAASDRTAGQIHLFLFLSIYLWHCINKYFSINIFLLSCTFFIAKLSPSLSQQSWTELALIPTTTPTTNRNSSKSPAQMQYVVLLQNYIQHGNYRAFTLFHRKSCTRGVLIQ